ncbi:MAG: CotH kinase family protein [Bacteroidales bacterium]|nr:CotH kinase family protein [Bacteroidales bacterium]
MKTIHRKSILTSVVMLTAAISAAAQEMTINEVMQSNIDGVYVDNEFPDSWVELYYSGDRTFRMGGYRIGQTTNYDEAVAINGSVVARPETFIMLYCDKTVRTNHINYRVDSGKGTLYLFNPQKEIIDQVTLKKQPAPNVAYGRETENSTKWGYEVNPTPGAPNASPLASGVLPDPVFSAESQILFRNSRYRTITVTIPEGAPEDAVLCVTTNGAEPTIANAVTGGKFSKYSNASEVIRAKLISPTMPSPMAVTRSYLVHGRGYSLPVFSIITDPKYISDPEMGIFVGENFLQDWRRPVYVEYFPTEEGTATISQLGEFRIHGGWTRNLAQKSMAFYANKRFGTKRYKYNFWTDRPGIDEYKSFVLRNGGNNFAGARINDALTQTLFARHISNLDWQAYQPTICYINGKYAGIYSLRERSNEDNIESNYDGLEDIDMVENWNELKAGTWNNYNQLVQLYNSGPTYEQMCDAIDVENFANTFILNSWAANTDYPGNNMVMWRRRAEGGKWRMLVKDEDFMAMNPTHKVYFSTILRTGSHASDTDEGNRPEAVKLFQVMCGFPEFVDYMTDKFTVYLGDFLRESVTKNLIEEMRSQLNAEYPHHIAHYNIPISHDDFNGKLDDLAKWCADRTARLYGIMSDYFSLGAPVPVSINPNETTVAFNGTTLTQPDYIGYYYLGRTIKLDAQPGMTWKATITYGNGSKRTKVYNTPNIELEVAANMASIAFEAVESSAINEITSSEEATVRIFSIGNSVQAESVHGIRQLTINDCTGRIVKNIVCNDFKASATLPHGIYIVTSTSLSGQKTTAKVKI